MKLTTLFLTLALGATVFAAVPVTATKDEAAFLKSSDPKLAANKKLVYDFFRIVLRAGHLDETAKYMAPDYIQHNPNAETGMKGFLEFFRPRFPKPLPIKDTLGDLVSIQAEGDLVALHFVREAPNPNKPNEKYSTIWTDLLRVQNGKLVEHWDSATIAPAAPAKK